MAGIIVLIVGISIVQNLRTLNADEKAEIQEESGSEEVSEQQQEVALEGYHLVTYTQSSSSNQFIQSLEVTAKEAGKIRFVIGSIGEDKVPRERTSFEVSCEKGENTFDMLDRRYLVKKNEYLLMDLAGQNVLYTKAGASQTALVQSEENKQNGNMPMVETDYLLPFRYTLEKVETYNVLVLGNSITTQNGGAGLAATSEKLDYYTIFHKRLENTFDNLIMNRISAAQWEKSEDKNKWLQENIPAKRLQNLDLAVVQLGDNDSEKDLDVFAADVKNMVNFLRFDAPNAEIVWLGPWNENKAMQNSLPGLAQQLHFEYINIQDLNTNDYRTLVPEKAVDENGAETTKDAYYPNNEAMQIISNRLMEMLKYEY